jgi:hypothetical protein
MHSLSPSLVGLPQKLKTAALLFALSSCREADRAKNSSGLE